MTEIGQASFFRSVAETCAPAVIRAGLVPAATVEAWLAEQRQLMNDGTFFGSGTYYNDLIRRA